MQEPILDLTTACKYGPNITHKCTTCTTDLQTFQVKGNEKRGANLEMRRKLVQGTTL
jgi:hypothetical protein